MGTKLRVEVGRYRELVFGAVLEQPEEVRGKRIFYEGPDGFELYSDEWPELSEDSLFVGGTYIERDTSSFSCPCESVDEAIALVETIKTTVASYNKANEGPMPKVEVIVKLEVAE